MKLLTKQILKLLPPLYTNEDKKPEEVLVPVKFFNPTGMGQWYATEYDPNERLFFGFVVLFEEELGYFSLDELEALRVPPFGLPIERDLWWDPDTTLKDVMEGKKR